jgi:CRISPR-associated protein Cmr4
MYKLAKPLFLICETPLHAGSGSDLGIVDLPIQRERHTSFPKIEASSLKGALREAFEQKADRINFIEENNNTQLSKDNFMKRMDFHQKIHIAFGYDSAFEKQIKNQEEYDNIKNDLLKSGHQDLLKEIKKKFANNSEFSGSLAFSDARLLLFPVKSMRGVFAWITCSRILQKLKSDLSLCEAAEYQKLFDEIDKVKDNDLVNVCYASTKVQFGKDQTQSKYVVLEEYAFKVQDINNFTLGVELQKLLQGADPEFGIADRLVVLNDNDFKDFVNLSTEVITRTKIDNSTGTVANGQLFTEEYLPAESILYSLVLGSAEFSKEKSTFPTAASTLEFFTEIPAYVQIGGNSTLGKGIVKTKFSLQKTANNQPDQQAGGVK